MTFWSVHTHSRYSAKDALPTVEEVVATSVDLGYPALGLTDHGNMGGAAQLYTACRKAGIEPLPGVEAYVALDRTKGKRPNTMHMGMVATSEVGYRNLVGLTNMASRNFRWKPVLDMVDLAGLAQDGLLDGVAALSGCWFGVLPTLLREGDPVSVRNLLVAMDGWFGDGLYVEMQHHNIHDAEHDDAKHAALIHSLAGQLGLPLVITQDSHYCHAGDRTEHDVMKRLMSWSDDIDDAVFPGDGYHMVDESWMAQRYSPRMLADGLAGLEDLLGKAKVVIPQLDEFHLAVPDLGGDPDSVLRMELGRGFKKKRDLGAIRTSHEKAALARMNDEVDVIVGAGFSGYLLLAKDVCDFMRREDIFFNVRGSGSGAFTLWLLEITSFNSIVWGLPFDRFLSTDRTKPPDIDIDVEHRRRQDVIAYIASKYHYEHIGTWLQMGLTDADGDQKGSLLVRWKAHARKTGQDPDAKVGSEEWRGLKLLADHQPYLGYGVHAAGLLVTPDEATAAAVPLQWVASSKTMVTAFGKDDIERMGLVKLDLLGLKTLTALKTMSRLTGIGLSEVPLGDAKTFNLIRSGRTTGLFQLEGGATARGVVKLAPKKIHDVIAAMALFRPATLESGATDAYIARRKGQQPIPQRHEWIMEETRDTYGILLYQEQALGIMKRLGLTVEEIEKARKAIKASNANVGDAREVLGRLREQIGRLATTAGFSEPDKAWLDEALDAYAGYGFNKAHATAYGVQAYVTAWFRANHPVAFWAGMLDAYADSQTEVWYGPYGQRARIPQAQAYRMEAVKDGVQVLPAHVNRSKESWSASEDLSSIRAGLTSIKGVGSVAAKELVAHQPYVDLSDLARKVAPRRVSGAKSLGLGHSPLACGGVIAALSHAGALHGLAAVPELPLKEPKKRTKKETT